MISVAERLQAGVAKALLGKAVLPDDLPWVTGIVVADPEKIGAAWEEALASDRPVILECYTDLNVPPLPPHITLKDAKNFMTMTASEPELPSVLKGSFR